MPKISVQPLNFFVLLCCFLSACSSINKSPESKKDIDTPASEQRPAAIPKLVTQAAPMPPSGNRESERRFTVVVKDVPVNELLFSLVRDANLNLDLQSESDVLVTLNAKDQAFTSILDRIAELAGLRYQISHGVVKVKNDTPYLKTYRIDYLNLARSSKGTVKVSTQISATGQGAGEGGSSEANNNSETSVSNQIDNSFWQSLQSNILAIISEGKAGGESVENNPNLLLNKEAGILGVRASDRHHRQISEFLYEVQSSSHRQVLIEATIAEVTLNKRHQMGVDWALLDDGLGSGVNAIQSFSDTSLQSPPNLEISVFDMGDPGGDILISTLRALEQFGDVSVVSSPKVMAMNNQTALLKVVDNLVYFTVDVTVESGTDGAEPITTYETEVNTVPVGFVMSVTPFVNEYDVVTLNVRPTISRVIDRVRDPNPDLARFDVINEIPVIQVREVESVLKVRSGNVAIIGGLMQDEISDTSNGIPLLSRIPYAGSLFRYKDKQSAKTELVIFLKPMVIENADMQGELEKYLKYSNSEL